MLSQLSRQLTARVGSQLLTALQTQSACVGDAVRCVSTTASLWRWANVMLPVTRPPGGASCCCNDLTLVHLCNVCIMISISSAPTDGMQPDLVDKVCLHSHSK